MLQTNEFSQDYKSPNGADGAEQKTDEQKPGEVEKVINLFDRAVQPFFFPRARYQDPIVLRSCPRANQLKSMEFLNQVLEFRTFSSNLLYCLISYFINFQGKKLWLHLRSPSLRFLSWTPVSS